MMLNLNDIDETIRRVEEWSTWDLDAQAQAIPPDELARMMGEQPNAAAQLLRAARSHEHVAMFLRRWRAALIRRHAQATGPSEK